MDDGFAFDGLGEIHSSFLFPGLGMASVGEPKNKQESGLESPLFEHCSRIPIPGKVSASLGDSRFGRVVFRAK